MAKTVRVVARRIRGQRRYCVESSGNRRPRGFHGKGSDKRFHGCFLRPLDAQTRKNKVARER